MNQKIANYAQGNININNEKIDISITPSNPGLPQPGALNRARSTGLPQPGALNAPLQHRKKSDCRGELRSPYPLELVLFLLSRLTQFRNQLGAL
jgi:hypothetical protein